MFSPPVIKIGTTKVGRQVPKPGVMYPTIRLPQNCAHTIGEEVSIYETEFGGRQSFLIVFEKGVAQPVAQPREDSTNCRDTPAFEECGVPLQSKAIDSGSIRAGVCGFKSYPLI
ncbi:MAG: hypothetical protein ABR887_09260 [Methanoregulaceae archaeon]|jgi:hypothetical protein